MATLETRLAKIEARIAPEIPADVRDPVLVELVRMFDKDCPIEQIPCGISGRRLLAELVKTAMGTSLSIIGDDVWPRTYQG